MQRIDSTDKLTAHMIFYKFKDVYVSGIAGKSGADRLNILNVKHTFEWCSFKLRCRLGYTFNTNVCAHVCMSTLLCRKITAGSLKAC